MTSDREQIDDLLTDYAIALDLDDIEAAVQLFTPDGGFEVYGRRFAGWDDLRAMMTAAPRGMHLAGRAQITVDGDRATVRSQLVFIEAAMTETRMAIYDDVVVKADGCWRFQTRRCRFLTPDGLSDRPAKLNR
ncbi:MAG TPA: nuclear transport factor 2 family protein [Frankiaceae bacterium]|jgi:uncharacterized protein (TIGR02246 family)|nr:nuclear transport factor 2 family protein [Frankiaceae bacterium]